MEFDLPSPAELRKLAWEVLTVDYNRSNDPDERTMLRDLMYEIECRHNDAAERRGEHDE